LRGLGHVIASDRPRFVTRRGGGQAGRADVGRARRPGARSGRSAGDQLSWPAPRVSAGQPPAPLGGPGADPRHPRCPGRRSAATTRARRGPPDVRAVPDREPAGRGTQSRPGGL